MDTCTGVLQEITESEQEGLEKRIRDNELQLGRLAPLSREQHSTCETLTPERRKGYMRNQPCVCGSGNKFKRCCWGKFK